MEHKIQIPTYEKIAIDLANRIYNGSFKIGDKLHGRSTLASEYKVSPETIRRAVKILEDVHIVKSNRGSGIEVLSREKAFEYMNRFSNLESVRDLEKQVHNILLEKERLDLYLQDTLKKILDYSGRLRNTNPLTPIEIEVPGNFIHLGKTISEVKFWQNTGGTIIGIKREGNLIVSPGPYVLILEKDILLIVGDEKIYPQVCHFLNVNLL
ncbi:GntR family transcriptional regulator [Anaeromicropila populeti]|uniref:Transcriptional regulator, GntR family n=1 Tax=Anaeromicropila populeti TaxID=37658 RepID=A0A1I6IQG4_9FIRM|nr:GntR family transcriptional regulator [Anaeromicropila populeti]SFR68881.1 transcriptional regulator, GntR family [Anaeromicropila populeti]